MKDLVKSSLEFRNRIVMLVHLLFISGCPDSWMIIRVTVIFSLRVQQGLKPHLNITQHHTIHIQSTVREQLFDTIALNDDISIKYSSKLKSKGSVKKLIQFCVQNCPWKLD